MSLALLTFILSIVVVDSCTYIKLEQDFFFGSNDIGFGPYKLDVAGSCEKYPDGFLDDEGNDKILYQTARGCSVTLIVLLGISLIFVVVCLLVPMKDKIRSGLWKAAEVQIGLSILMSLGIATLYGTEVCTFRDGENIGLCLPGTGGYIAAANSLLLVVVSSFSCAPPPPSSSVFEKDGDYEDNDEDSMMKKDHGVDETNDDDVDL